MITRIHGSLLRLEEEFCILGVEAFEYQVLIPEFTRRQLQQHVRENISLHMLHYIEGNAAQGGRLTPRLVGFYSEFERDFFEMFCSVDGVGVKKALRAMSRPVQDIARSIENQDVKALSTLPGIGAATAEKIIAKLRRKMARFALLVAVAEGAPQVVERDVLDETYQILVSLGYSDTDARSRIDKIVESGKKYKDVDSLLQAIWERSND